MRLAEEIGMSPEASTALYYAALLKNSGCSSNAARVSALFGHDDHGVKRQMKSLVTEGFWSRMRAMMRVTAPGAPWWRRLGLVMRMPSPSQVEHELLAIRCDRGSLIARKLGFPEATSETLACLDERWDVSGYPHALEGEAIAHGARIVAMAQTIDVFQRQPTGVSGAVQMLRTRRGRWFDPQLADAVLRWANDRSFWALLDSPDVSEIVHALAPAGQIQPVAEAGIDAIAEAFADIVDAKSPFTYRHSTNVATLAHAAATHFTADAHALRRIGRAGLLHDLGKLGVSSAILEKRGPLDAHERTSMQAHPQHTWDILSGMGAFRDFAMLAAVHHEKLDGSGYCWGFRGDELGPLERVLVVADTYEALTADRPYRAALSREQALTMLRSEQPVKLCRKAIDALTEVTASRSAPDVIESWAEPFWSDASCHDRRKFPSHSTLGDQHVSHPVTISDADFDRTLTEANTPTLVDFWAPWCGPCRFMNPVLEQLAEQQGDALTIAKLNIDDNEATAQRFGVRSIPTLVLFHEGQEVGRHVGVMPAAQLQEWVAAHTPHSASER